jgi:pyridoxal phosphate-dependent aminotransferase EpsN
MAFFAAHGRKIDYVADAFATNWVAPLGPNVDAFEKQLAAFVGVKGVVSLSSGSAALHLALNMVGVKQEMLYCARVLLLQHLHFQ